MKYEYSVKYWDGYLTLVDWLNAQAVEGWRLVAVTEMGSDVPVTAYIFERPKAEG